MSKQLWLYELQTSDFWTFICGLVDCLYKKQFTINIDVTFKTHFTLLNER